MKTLIVSTINPYGNIDYQIACFHGWRKRGYLAKSFNSQHEKELLLGHGLESCDIVEISSEETSLTLFGKEIPRILPILVRAAKFEVDNVILVNSDIYPGHTCVVSEYLRSISSIIAMTRSDFIGQPNADYFGDTHYRGGLDIFFFTADGLKAVIDNLNDIAIAARMTFGVPGWDFFLGHEIIHTHSGVIMDSAVMFHQHHKTSYCDVQEFETYADHLFRSGFYKNKSGLDLVSEFSSTIQAQCIHNENLSRLLSDRFFEEFRYDYDDTRKSQKTSLVYEKLLILAKKYSIKLDDASLAPLISNQLSEEYWEGAVFFRHTYLTDLPYIEGYLLVLLIALLVKDSRSGTFCTTIYPLGNQHSDVLKKVIMDPGTVGLDVEVLRLFSSELVDYSIFNMDLFKHIVLSSYTDNMAGLCMAVMLLCQKGLLRNISDDHNSEKLPFIVDKGQRASIISNKDTFHSICMAEEADCFELAKSIVIKTVTQLIEGGVESICIALNTLIPLENILISNLHVKDKHNIYPYSFLQETMGEYIEEQKQYLLNSDLQKNA